MALARAVRALLFEVSATDPATLAAVAILVAIALAASYFPARRASVVDPILSFRSAQRTRNPYPVDDREGRDSSLRSE